MSWTEASSPDALLAALLALFAVIVFRRPLASLATKCLRWVLGSLSISLSEHVITEINAALRVILVTSAVLLTLDAIHLPDVIGGALRRLLISVLVLSVFATWYRLVEPFVAVLDPEKLTGSNVDTSWVARLGQFIVILLAITALLAVWEIDISNALTGVGVFGAGLAIAAQDFVRNLFAGMSNMSEKRFGPGDWIAVDGGIEGIVSRVDMRSTTILGFDRVPRYVPNAELSNAVVLNKSRMDHRRVYWTIPLVLSTSDAQVEQICDALRAHLSESGAYVDDGSLFMTVMPVGLSDSSLDIMIYAFVRDVSYQGYLDACAELTLVVRRAIADAGAHLAYPTQTVFVHRADTEQSG